MMRVKLSSFDRNYEDEPESTLGLGFVRAVENLEKDMAYFSKKTGVNVELEVTTYTYDPAEYSSRTVTQMNLLFEDASDYAIYKLNLESPEMVCTHCRILDRDGFNDWYFSGWREVPTTSLVWEHVELLDETD